jgi:hypothetical protein
MKSELLSIMLHSHFIINEENFWEKSINGSREYWVALSYPQTTLNERYWKTQFQCNCIILYTCTF